MGKKRHIVALLLAALTRERQTLHLPRFQKQGAEKKEAERGAKSRELHFELIFAVLLLSCSLSTLHGLTIRAGQK